MKQACSLNTNLPDCFKQAGTDEKFHMRVPYNLKN